MKIVCVLTLLVVVALHVKGGPVGNNTATSDEEQICVTKDRLQFEEFFIKAETPEVPEGACLEAISVYLAANATASDCLEGYARHPNGRCYKIVDRPQDGRPLEEHEYRITYRSRCLRAVEEILFVNLDPLLQTVDFCDEDGGCVEVQLDAVVRSVVPTICGAGLFLSPDGKCRQIVTGKPPQNPKPPKQGG